MASLRLQRRFKEAEKLAENAIKQLPNSVTILNELGLIYYDQNQYDKTREVTDKVLAIESKNEFAIQLKIASFRMEDKLPEAEKLAEDSLNLLPKNSRIVYERGFIYLQGGQLDKAEELYLKAMELDPEYAPALGGLGVIAFKRGHNIKSEDYLRRSIQVDPTQGSYVDLGALYVQMGRYDEAEDALKKAREINQNDAQAHFELGNLYLQTERGKEAVREFRHAFIIDPNNEDKPNALAIALMRVGEFSEAEKILRNAILRLDESKRWRLHLTFSQLLTHIGDKEKDKQFYNEALKEVSEAKLLNPEHMDVYFYKGIVQFKLEDYWSALNDFRKCRDNKDYEHNFEAERNAKRIQRLFLSETLRGSRISSIVIVLFSAGILITLWRRFLYFEDQKITDNMLIVLTPILLGLIIVACLLPSLIRLKLPGVEAELSQPKQAISTGPSGEIGFGTSLPSISSGPRLAPQSVAKPTRRASWTSW